MGDDLAGLSSRFLADRQRLFAYVFALVRSRQVAEDIFQDVYLALTRAVGRGDLIADLSGWCRGVARNLALRHWRERQRLERLPMPELLDGIDLAFAEDDTDDEESLLRALAECRRSLSGPSAAMLDLKYVHGLSVQDIAERSRRSERAVITALAKVRRRLQECINARLAGAPYA